MVSFQEYMQEYRKELEKGYIQEAYKGLMGYMMDLKAHFKNKYPEYFISGSIYYGYMDMTYFAISPESFKNQKLKIAIVFLHQVFRFEVWLAGYNKNVQKEYWELFKENNWDKYHVPPTIQGADSILEHILVEEPDFSDLDNLTEQIETGTVKFIEEVEKFLENKIKT